MTAYRCKSPILFLTFNRLDTTKEVFNQIKKVKPSKIYLASDGARDKIDMFGIKEKFLLILMRLID